MEAKGHLWNFNTLEKFKTADRNNLVKQVAARIWSDIKTGAAEKHPELLSAFLLMTHAELKSYKFFYWYDAPAATTSCQHQLCASSSKDCNDGISDSCRATALAGRRSRQSDLMLQVFVPSFEATLRFSCGALPISASCQGG